MLRRAHILILFIIALGLAEGHAIAKRQRRLLPKAELLKRAQDSFKNQKYDKAVLYYRRYLRRAKTDYDVWNQLAASYYHTGLAKKSLIYLQKFAKKTRVRSYNFYYQGLAYSALEKPIEAKFYFTQAAKYTDPYGERATFEMAAVEYNARANVKAAYWLKLYRQRYPRGIFIQVVTKMEQSLRTGKFIPGIVGNKKPDLEKALFRYNKYSLMNRPHYWYARAGGDLNFGSQMDPSNDAQGVKERQFLDHSLKLATGIGLGPLEANNAKSWIGYNYKQDWITDADRLTEFQENPASLESFPYRLDLLERRHEIYGDLRYEYKHQYHFGVFASQEYARIGSMLSTDTDEQEATTLSNTSLMVPWAGVSYLQNYMTTLYLFFHKEFKDDARELSNKTYDLFSGGTPIFSWGLRQHAAIPEHKVTVKGEIYQYEYIYNDNWLDFSRFGLYVGADFEFIRDLYLEGLLGYYQDTYIEHPIAQGACKFSERDKKADPAVPVECPRTDTGFFLRVGMYYDYSDFSRFAVRYTMVQNSNADQELYNRTDNILLATYTFAFPNVGRVLRFVERYADAAFTKRVE